MPQATERGAFQFTAPIHDVQMAKSGDPSAKGQWTMRGHAAVFNRKSHDLGGFRTVIAPNAFTDVLDSNPDVHLNREHDMRLLLARTSNKSLELRQDPMGLHAWARFAPTALADETATLMQGGYLDQMSFACDIGTDTWTENEAGDITRTITSVSGLYDVCVCAQGAFPQTDAKLITATLPDAGAQFERAKEQGLIKTSVAPSGVGAQEQENIAPPEEGVDVVAASRGARDLAALKRNTYARYALLTHPE